jgi:hypothetical protein
MPTSARVTKTEFCKFNSKILFELFFSVNEHFWPVKRGQNWTKNECQLKFNKKQPVKNTALLSKIAENAQNN